MAHLKMILTPISLKLFFKAEWQSGYAADCNSVNIGSIPFSASIFMKNYFAILFLIANYLIYLALLPFVEKNYSDFFTLSILIFSIFGTLSNLNFGVPPLIIREHAKQNYIYLSLAQNTAGILIFIVLIYTFTLNQLDNKLLLHAIYISGSLIFLLNLYRARFEATSSFIVSYFIKFICICILPLAFIFLLLEIISTTIFIIVLVASLATPFLILKKRFIKQKKALLDIKSLFPLFLQFTLAFLFLYSDRWVVLYFHGPEIFASFTFEFELTAKFALPVGFLLTVIFPLIVKQQKTGSDYFGIYAPLITYLVLFIPALAALNWIYDFYNYESMSKILNENFLKITACIIAMSLNLFLQKIFIGIENYKNMTFILIVLMFSSLLAGTIVSIFFADPYFVILLKSFVEILVLGVWMIRSKNEMITFFK